MIVDSSAIVAILLEEPSADRLRLAISSAADRWVSAATVLESAIVMRGKGGHAGPSRVFALRDALEMRVVAVTEEQVALAIEGYLRFGPGSGSQARLNYGDCFSYALARATRGELLFAGDDFTHTDITPARW